MSNEIKKFHENVLNIEIDGFFHTIHRRNLAGLCFSKMKPEGYSIWFNLIKPLYYWTRSDGQYALNLQHVTFEDYLEYVDWFDNPRPHYHSYSEVEGGKSL